MAEYLVLIYENESGYADGGPEIYGEVMEAHNRFAEKHGAALRGGNALTGSDTATTIRGDVVTDGPFVESKEILGGYYLIEAADLDEAVTLAARIPPVRAGSIEVRPVRELDPNN